MSSGFVHRDTSVEDCPSRMTMAFKTRVLAVSASKFQATEIPTFHGPAEREKPNVALCAPPLSQGSNGRRGILKSRYSLERVRIKWHLETWGRVYDAKEELVPSPHSKGARG